MAEHDDDFPGYAGIQDAVRNTKDFNGKANGHSKTNGKTNPWRQQAWEHLIEPFEELDYITLSERSSMSREWLIENWFPMYETHGLGGPGGEGKTLLAHQLATCAALGLDWFGMHVRQMPAALILCEDRAHDAILRQIDINRHYGCSMSDLAGRLMTVPRRNNLHNYLAIFDRDGEMHTTTFFDQLLTKLQDFGARLVVLDTRADVFRGNQNDEAHARMFVRQVCDRIAWHLQGLVILLFQPSLAGMTSGVGTSGSIQWDASYRSRSYLTRSSEAEGNQRRLSLPKTNHSQRDDFIDILWEKGVFVLASPSPAANAAGIDLNQAMADFLNCLDRCTANGRAVSSNWGRNFAPKVFAEMLCSDADDKTIDKRKKLLDRAMSQLFHRQEIKDEPYDPRNKKSAGTRIVRVV